MNNRQFRKPSNNTSWDKVAGWYDQHVTESSDFHKELIIPGTLKLLGPRAGEKILDLGCGQGVFSKILAEKGALVTGVDSSRKLIDIAMKRGDKNIEYIVSDATKLSGINSAIFDSVVSILALSNMDPLADVIKQASRVLKPAGRFLFIINHPCFRIPRQSGWGFDEKRKLQYRRVDRYMTPLKIPIQMHPGAAPGVVTWTFHRPLSEYSRALRDNGFVIDKLEEWVSHRKSGPGKLARSENQSRDEIPMFLALLAVRK
jgi:ubiquinone/menaquinone biosynthesis C-methylase UbiE